VAEELKAAESRGPLRSEYVMVARDGRLVPVRDDATVVRDAEGKPLYVQGFLVDLGDRQELVQELERVATARGEVRADALRRQARLDLAVAAGETLGSAPDVESALRRLAELVVREFADWCAVDLVEDEGEISRLTASHAKPIHDAGTRAAAPDALPDGDVRQVAESGEAIVVPALDGGSNDDRPTEAGGSRIVAPLIARGHPLGVLTFVRGGSARTFAADDLQLALDIARRAALTLDAERLHHRVELEADAARVLAYVADGVFLVDRPGVIRLWNPAAEAITGFPAASMVGRRPSEAIPGWENFREQIPVADSGGPALPQTVWIESDDEQRWISISAVEFFGGTVYAFRDITEAHRLEELKGDFVATASHELRTPLAAVYGAAQTLRRHDFALDEAGRERFVTMIVEEADRLSRIVNEILLATQLDAGGPALAAEPFDPADLVNRVAEATRSHLRPEITLEVAVSGRPPEVAADRDKVRQVLVNLIDNAVKYSPSGGNVEVGVEPDGANVRFHVRDEGLGIPANEQERIFQKFYRLDPSMTRGVGGTGLGLYICHELVRRMGGRIWVESEHGDGSTFSFELPAAASVPSSAPEPAETTGRGR
jgi:PAS domain S-box-containing protein